MQARKYKSLCLGIVFLENQLWLEELSNSYGSYVNNRKAAGDEIVLLAENSEIRLGDVRFSRVA